MIRKGDVMTTTEETAMIDEEMMDSLKKAMQQFQEDGVDTLPAIGPYRDPGFLLVYPDETITISCCRIDTEETPLYRYTLFVYDGEPWSFPCFFMPAEYEGILLLPMLYRAIRFGMPGERDDAEIQRAYAVTRLPHLQEILLSLSMESRVIEEPDGTPCVVAEEGEEEVRFSYEAVFPEWEAAVLKIEGEEETALLPEFGPLLTREEYEVLLSHVFL